MKLPFQENWVIAEQGADMQDSVSIAQPMKQGSIGTTVPQWALERIRDAKERKLEALDLSVVAGEERECLSKLPESLFELIDLTSLKLSNNSLTGLPEAITRLQRLTILDLSENQLSALPEVVTRLPNLTALVLSGNQLSSLPESLTKLQNLTVLVLSGNQFTSLPEVVTQLNNLTNLDLSFNQLTNLPESLDQLHNLTALSLVDNQLSFLPESITQLQHLTNLNLSDNQLTSLPESLCHSKLVFDLFFDLFQAPIGCQVRDQHFLQAVELGSELAFIDLTVPVLFFILDDQQGTTVAQ